MYAPNRGGPVEAPELIRKKRDGQALTRAEVFEFIECYTRGEVPDYQCAALLMASFFRGLDARETADLAEALRRSGQQLDLSAFPQPKIVMHSAGGVGEKTSLVVAPVAAAGGLLVPMISSRGLEQTSGTLDKLASIPGFRTNLTLAEFRRVLGVCGLGLIDQTEELVAAGRRLCALRQATATLECIPLIAASIMSQMLAEDIDGLVLDVKTGSGAFMPEFREASKLARCMVEVGATCGISVQTLITDMSQPLGNAVGNALEVIEAVETLKGRGPADLVELSREFAAYMFLLGGVATTLDAARARFDSLLASGQALERFAQLVAAQDGDAEVVRDYARLPRAQYEDSVVAPAEGFVADLEAGALGQAVRLLGGRREPQVSGGDAAVGLALEKKVGDPVAVGERICALYANDRARLARAHDMVRSAIVISPEPVAARPLILDRVPGVS